MVGKGNHGFNALDRGQCSISSVHLHVFEVHGAKLSIVIEIDLVLMSAVCYLNHMHCCIFKEVELSCHRVHIAPGNSNKLIKILQWQQNELL